MCDAELLEQCGCLAHHVPVGVGAHHDADERITDERIKGCGHPNDSRRPHWQFPEGSQGASRLSTAPIGASAVEDRLGDGQEATRT